MFEDMLRSVLDELVQRKRKERLARKDGRRRLEG